MSIPQEFNMSHAFELAEVELAGEWFAVAGERRVVVRPAYAGVNAYVPEHWDEQGIKLERVISFVGEEVVELSEEEANAFLLKHGDELLEEIIESERSAAEDAWEASLGY